MSNFYKIECKDTLKLIDDFFDKRDVIYRDVVNLCKHFGFDNHITSDHIVFGVSFSCMVADPEKTPLTPIYGKHQRLKIADF